LAALLARVKNIPAVLTCHEALLNSLTAYAEERGFRRRRAARAVAWLLDGIYRLGMQCFSQRIAVSQRTAEALARENYPAAHVLKFGLEPEAFATDLPEPAPGPRRFIFCGRLTAIKAVDLILRAFFLLRQNEKLSFRFDIVGDGSEKARLHDLVRAAGAEAVVAFHGEVSEVRKRELFRRSEIFVLGSHREGFSIATLEAMAQGCTALIANDPSHPSGALDFVLENKTGLVVTPEENPFAAALRRLIENPELTLRLRQAAWRQAHEYRLEAQVTAAESIYIAAIRAATLPPERSKNR
jgi:glycosyltransferase involved in cell wall biosynthesis